MPKHVLVADDDPAILTAIKMALEDEGYQVTTSVNGETVQAIHEDLPDLILLDIWMSGMDGGEIARHLKSQNITRHIPIIMVSANRDCEKIAKQCGAEDFLPKPFDVDDLVGLVEKYTQGSPQAQPASS